MISCQRQQRPLCLSPWWHQAQSFGRGNCSLVKEIEKFSQLVFFFFSIAFKKGKSDTPACCTCVREAKSSRYSLLYLFTSYTRSVAVYTNRVEILYYRFCIFIAMKKVKITKSINLLIIIWRVFWAFFCLFVCFVFYTSRAAMMHHLVSRTSRAQCWFTF